MQHFEVTIIPTEFSRQIMVSNFHPQWQEGAKKLMETNIESRLERYLEQMRFNSPVSIEFAPDYGLTHIRIPERRGLDLDLSKKKYVSHNIVSDNDTGVVLAVWNRYSTALRSAIEYLNEQRSF